MLDPTLVQNEMVHLQRHFRDKRDFVVRRLREMGFVIKYVPDSTFYLWLNLEGLPESIADGLNFFQACLEEKVIVVPGIFFDLNPSRRRDLFDSPCHHFVRFSYGPRMDVLRMGLDGIERVVTKHKKAAELCLKCLNGRDALLRESMHLRLDDIHDPTMFKQDLPKEHVKENKTRPCHVSGAQTQIQIPDAPPPPGVPILPVRFPWPPSIFYTSTLAAWAADGQATGPGRQRKAERKTTLVSCDDSPASSHLLCPTAEPESRTPPLPLVDGRHGNGKTEGQCIHGGLDFSASALEDTAINALGGFWQDKSLIPRLDIPTELPTRGIPLSQAKAAARNLKDGSNEGSGNRRLREMLNKAVLKTSWRKFPEMEWKEMGGPFPSGAESRPDRIASHIGAELPLVTVGSDQKDEFAAWA
ncbi:hypothetical protein E4U43_002112 [Claviceps pusilla]|uniref:Aminotransferase class I/classII large domain-containing protein n=1 Tax=Claviceps pusilla TaxID=123648 RepID=A0A9P7SVG4_9HYPO|nr:hypothetical protein E4U43_002112 [Claviceps pusilla]